jgi:2-enoate reductase
MEVYVNRFDVLFQPVQIGKITLHNRIAMAPMGIDYMVDSDGSLNRRVMDYYFERIRHGVGMIICSVFKVENRVEALEACTPMIGKTSLEYLKELCNVAHAFGVKIFIQLTAGYGRVTVPHTLRGACVSASPTPNFWDPSLICRELTTQEIGRIIRAMGETAERLVTAGVDGIELHGHEGYLLDQFTSAIWNHRTDEFGGTLENRLRFPTKCLEEIRHRIGDSMVLQYRFGLKHYLKDINHGALPGELFDEVGRDVAEGQEMAKRLEQAGFDALHVDAGCYESHYWPHPPNYQKHGCMMNMAANTKAVVSIPVIGVGRLDKPEVAAHAVADGMMDVVAIGRGFLADPQWVDKVRSGRTEDIRPCVGCYDGCFGSYGKMRHISCALNPSSGRENAYRLEPATRPCHIMVIGGGVAGLEAARVAALRGHRLSLYEKKTVLGGLVRMAAVPSFKKDLCRLLEWYERQIEQNGVDVYLDNEVTPDIIRSVSPDAVIVATGARPIVPDIAGINRESVVTAVDLLKGEKKAGDRVVIVGGGLAGCEVAIWLADKGRQTIIVEMLPDLMIGGAQVPGQVRMMTMDLLTKYNTTIITDNQVDEITPDGVLLARRVSDKSRIEADTVVLSTGMIPDTHLISQLDNTLERVYRIGDCREPGNVMNAVWDAYEIARII